MKSKLLVIATTALLFAACSDSFLDRAPEGNYVDITFYTSDEVLEAATAPLYNQAWFDYNQHSIAPIDSRRASGMYSPWNYPQFVTFQVTALDENLSGAWNGFYSVAMIANSVINAVGTQTQGSVSEVAKTKAIAEARLARARAYFYMLHTWGPVILIEDNQKLVDNSVRPLNCEEDVLQLIINDLNYAVDSLSEQSDKGRAISWAAKEILAKVYLARSGWNNGDTRDEGDLEPVHQYASDVCENSGLDLMANYEDPFKYKNNNNQESLFAVQWVPLGERYECNILLPDLAFSTEVMGGVNCWSSYSGSIDTLQQYELADTLRRNATFFTKGSYYSYICIRDDGYTYKGTASPIKKGVPGGPDDDNDGKMKQMSSPLNTYILRLTDVYLTYTGTCLGNDSTLSDGRGLHFFSRVRKRAKINEKSSITLDDIIHERRVELGMEYSNWYDMVTWLHYLPGKMLNCFNNQWRGYRADAIIKDEDGKLHFGKYDADGTTLLEGPEYYIAPEFTINIEAEDIFLPYPESDVIQNPLLNEPPIPYALNE